MGLSIYVPDMRTSFTEGGYTSPGGGVTAGLQTNYRDFVFDKNTGWSAFTDYLISVQPASSRRQPGIYLFPLIKH